MPKPELEFHQPTAPWRPSFSAVEGFWEQVLSRDGDTGDYTRLVRVDPGADSSPAGRLAHSFWEEIYIVAGDLTDIYLNETFTAGMYACRPPGMLHGPFRSASGCLMLEIRYGVKPE
ncbi:MAG: cupin domain-containing protein [Chloroflexi bacterium]|nr:cupin domain-containing protein [Chloroflexota bacterium]MCI0727785.1 cupin domain-containing protein [Chloroflexota bacterium]